MRKWLVNNTSVYFFSSPGLLEHDFMKKTAREKRWSARVSRLECTQSPRPVDRGRPQCPVSYPDNNSASHLLGKPALFRNIIGANSENQHRSNFECWKRLLNGYLHSKYHVRIKVNTDHDCKSQWHFGAGLANYAKRECVLLSICYLMVILHGATFLVLQLATSPNVAVICPLLSNSMEWILTCAVMWSWPSSSSFGIVLVDFRSTKRALFEVLSTKSSTKRRKNEGRSKH